MYAFVFCAGLAAFSLTTDDVWRQGTADPIVPYNEASKIQALLPQAELFSIEGGSHYLTTEEGSKEKVREKLIEFLLN